MAPASRPERKVSAPPPQHFSGLPSGFAERDARRRDGTASRRRRSAARSIAGVTSPARGGGLAAAGVSRSEASRDAEQRQSRKCEEAQAISEVERGREPARPERPVSTPAIGCAPPLATAEKPPLRLAFGDRRRSVTCGAVMLRGGFIGVAVAVARVRCSLDRRRHLAGSQWRPRGGRRLAQRSLEEGQ